MHNGALSLASSTALRHWDAARLESTVDVTRRIDAATDQLDGALITTGLGFHGNLADMTIEASDKVLQRLLQVNAVGPSLLSQHCAAKMRVTTEARKGSSAPTLLLLSSYSGVVGLAHRAAYSSSKFALNGYLESVVRFLQPGLDAQNRSLLLVSAAVVVAVLQWLVVAGLEFGGW